MRPDVRAVLCRVLCRQRTTPDRGRPAAGPVRRFGGAELLRLQRLQQHTDGEHGQQGRTQARRHHRQQRFQLQVPGRRLDRYRRRRRSPLRILQRQYRPQGGASRGGARIGRTDEPHGPRPHGNAEPGSKRQEGDPQRGQPRRSLRDNRRVLRHRGQALRDPVRGRRHCDRQRQVRLHPHAFFNRQRARTGPAEGRMEGILQGIHA